MTAPDQTAPAPLLDYPAPMNRSNMIIGLCHALGTLAMRLDWESPSVLDDALRGAQVLASLDPSRGVAQAAQFMTTQARAIGAELYPEKLLAEFRAEGERRAALGLDPVTGKPERQDE